MSLLNLLSTPFGTVQETSNPLLTIIIFLIIFWGLPTIIAILYVKIKGNRKKKTKKKESKDEK